jgi:hypothetical protein
MVKIPQYSVTQVSALNLAFLKAWHGGKCTLLKNYYYSFNQFLQQVSDQDKYYNSSNGQLILHYIHKCSVFPKFCIMNYIWYMFEGVKKYEIQEIILWDWEGLKCKAILETNWVSLEKVKNYIILTKKMTDMTTEKLRFE